MPDPFQPSAADMAYAARYLQSFGYAEPLPPSVPGGPAFAPTAPGTDALALFQDFAGLPVTRELDAATLDKMKQPRCGVPDIARAGVELARWRKNRLTYFVEKFVNGIPVREQQTALRAAWDDWEKSCDIELQQTQEPAQADIIISIGKGRADNFDGPSGTLAWAFLPNGSDQQLLMRFDVDEAWTIAGGGIRYRNVAGHEFGHLLGLPHSRVPTALMAPIYSPAVVSPQANDDVSRIKALYGPPVGGGGNGGDPPPPVDPSCKTVNDCLRTLSNSLSSIRHGRAFTVAGTTLSQEFSQLVQRVGELPCDKIGPLITAVAAAFAACQQPAPAALSLPCLGGGGGGLPCSAQPAANPCAALTGLLAICSQLGPILKACPAAPTT